MRTMVWKCGGIGGVVGPLASLPFMVSAYGWRAAIVGAVCTIALAPWMMIGVFLIRRKIIGDL